MAPTFAVTDDFDLGDGSWYTVSDSNKAYVHWWAAKLKWSLSHRSDLENGPAALDWVANIIIDGNFLYAASYGWHAMTVIDITDPTAMTATWYLGADGTRKLYWAYDLKKVGDYVYVASYNDDDLEIIDVSDPTNPVHEARFNDNGTTLMDGIRGIDVVGGFAYLAAYRNDALQIIDVTDPGNPTATGSLQDTRLNGATSVRVVWDYAYVTSNIDDSFQVIDVSDKWNPTFVAEITDTATEELNGAWGLEIVGNLAFITWNVDDGLEIIDITDPTNPVHTWALDNSVSWVFLNGAREIDVVWDYAYISAYTDDSLEIVDITDPTNPTHVWVLDTANGRLNSAAWIAVSGTDVFITSYVNSTLQSIDASTPATPTFQDELLSGPARLGNAVGMLIDGDYMYSASFWWSSVWVFDITDSANPIHTGSISDDHTSNELFGAWGVVKSWDYLYVSWYSDDGIEVVDVSDPNNPTGVARVTKNDGVVELDNPRWMDVSGDFLYVTSYNRDALQIIDISVPTAPVARWFIRDTSRLDQANDVKVSGNYAFVTWYRSDNVSVIDISDPDAPTYEIEYDDDTTKELNGAWDIIIEWDYAIVTWHIDDGIEIIDISDPTNPVNAWELEDTGSIRLNWPRGIVYDEWYVYTAQYQDDSIIVTDISDPTDPLYIDEIRNTTLYDRANDIDKKDNDIFSTQYIWSSMAVVRESYPSDSPYVIPNRHVDSSFFNSMSITLGTFNEWDVTFQLSKDDGVTRYYFNGSSWATTTGWTSESNDVTTINANVGWFNALPWTDEIKWKAFLNGDGTQKVELDNVLIDYLDISPPVIDSTFPATDNLIPKHNFDIVFNYHDVDGAIGSGWVLDNNWWVGIDTTSDSLQLFKWDGVSSWWSDIASTHINFTWSIISTWSATYPTLDMDFWKYRMDFSIDDLNGNSTSTWVIFYIDVPEFNVSTWSIDIGTLNDASATFSPSVTITVKTVGAGFDVYMNTTTPPSYGIDQITDWDGMNGYWYDQSPFSGSISTMGTNQNITTQSWSINTDWNKNTYTYDIQLWALIESQQVWGDYNWNIDFWINISY